jgi:hypothetical protein
LKRSLVFSTNNACSFEHRGKHIGKIRADHPGFIKSIAIESLELSRKQGVQPSNWNAEAEVTVDGLIYLIGLIVVIMAILSFFGLR